MLAVGWAELWKQRFGPIMSYFWCPFFHFFGVKIFFTFFWKHYSVRTEKLRDTFFIKKNSIFFDPEKVKKNPTWAKNLSLSTKTLRSVLCLLLLWSHHIQDSTNPWIRVQALFLLLDLIISQFINHVTCYKFKCSHSLKYSFQSECYNFNQRSHGL